MRINAWPRIPVLALAVLAATTAATLDAATPAQPAAAIDGPAVFERLKSLEGTGPGHSKRLELALVDDNHASVHYIGSRTGRRGGVELERVR